MLHYLRMLIEKRRAIQMTTSKYTYSYISLGYDCLPRTLLTKWGIMPPKKKGTLTCPFDLSVHPLSAVIRLIESNFSDYLSPENFCLNDKGLPIHRTLQITFNHEQDPALHEDQFYGLRKIYEKRIQNFLLMANNPNAIFVVNVRESAMANVPNLLNALSKFGEKPLIIITDSESKLAPISNLAHIINIEHPKIQGYKWYLPEFFATAASFKSEEAVINKILCLLKAWK